MLASRARRGKGEAIICGEAEILPCCASGSGLVVLAGNEK